MTVGELSGDVAALVPGAHRVVRMLDAGEGPFAGALVALGDAVAVRADAADMSGWAGWCHAGSEHVAGPLDVARRADGQDVLLPWCTERILMFLGRRSVAGVGLGAGETSTLVVSLLRGLLELGDAGGETLPGDWWLTDDGRPVFVFGSGESARAGAAHIMDRLREEQQDRAMARLLAAVHEGLVQADERPRMPRLQLERWEGELLELAAPRPLRRDVHAPERVRDIDRMRATMPASGVRRRDARAAALGRAVDSRATRLRRRADAMHAALAEAASRVVERVGRMRRARVRSRPMVSAPRSETAPAAVAAAPRRGRKLAVAGAAAAAVIAGGLLWPGGATGDPEKPDRAPAPAATVAASAGHGDEAIVPGTGAAERETPSAADGDPVVAAEGLLELIDACAEAGDDGCVSAVAPGSTGIMDALATAAGSRPGLALVDEYGDVAVIRLTEDGDESGSAGDGGMSERMIVLVRLDEKWLVRDVYGVADQPG